MFFTSGTTGYLEDRCSQLQICAGPLRHGPPLPGSPADCTSRSPRPAGYPGAGQWLCEGAVFVYDFGPVRRREDPADVRQIQHHDVLCAMYRMLIKQDLSRFDLSSIQHATTAGEALNPEVYYQFEKATGCSDRRGLRPDGDDVGHCEPCRPAALLGSMGKPIPGYGIDLVDRRQLTADGDSARSSSTPRDASISAAVPRLLSGQATHRAARHDGLLPTPATSRGAMRTAYRRRPCAGRCHQVLRLPHRAVRD